jgi:hypothetical protein
VKLIYARGYIAECNDVLAQMYGYRSSDDLQGVRWLDLQTGRALDAGSDQATLKLVSKSALLNSAEDYITRLKNAPRRNRELQPVANAIAEQFIRDQEASINPGEYVLKDEYGATKVYQVTENNSKVVFIVRFYFYGGILSGWSVEPEEDSYKKYMIQTNL